MVKISRLLSFAVLMSLIAVTSLFGESKTVAFLEKSGKSIEGTQVYEEEVMEVYEHYLSYYGSFDELFEEPYVKAYILNDFLRERVIGYLASVEKLASDEFVKKYSFVTEDDLKKYYTDNREQLMEEEYVDIDYAIFETQEEAQKFYEKALKEGFQKAIESTEDVQSDSYDGLKKSETNELFLDVLFGKYENNIRIQYTERGNYVFFVRNHNDLSTFEKFKSWPNYSEVADKIGKEKLKSYIDAKIKSENIKVNTSDAYLIWLDFVNGKDPKKIFNEYSPKVFSANKAVITNNSWLIAGIVTAIEDSKSNEEFRAEYQSAVSKLYNMGYKTFSVLSRMRQFDNSERVKLEYNVELSKILLEYIEQEEIMNVLQYIYNNLSELEELSNSSNKDIRLKAMEYLYYMYKALEDDHAEEYYNNIIKEQPNYKFERH
ncbi:MAG: peptidylprolyl isomerase [Fervidobacterium sp.]|nr:peptidylprolyl isomerase [Fervidobacterium sp.]